MIANADTVMIRPTSELLAELFPNVPLKKQLGPNETLLSIEKARRVLGYEPAAELARPCEPLPLTEAPARAPSCMRIAGFRFDCGALSAF